MISNSPKSLKENESIHLRDKSGNSFKRFCDISFSLFVLLLGCPVFIFIALLVKLSSYGPIFYIQDRVGKNLRSFGCIKFRTMYPEADDLLAKLLENNQEIREEFERDFKLKFDPRITPIGRFLRRTSLDELPQFINVIIGDMSVVGPRPIVVKEVEKYGTFIKEFSSVRPGLTGLWQVSGRNNLSYKRRVDLDVIYVRNRNLIMDLRILLRTFAVLLLPMDRGAY